MSLLDGLASGGKEKPFWRRGQFWGASAAVLLLFFLYIFANYGEERAVRKFLATLQVQEYESAYQLWQPSISYRYRDFVLAWGERGDYGEIREFEILEAKSKGVTGVIVTVRINNVSPPLDFWVSRKTRALSYSPF